MSSISQGIYAHIFISDRVWTQARILRPADLTCRYRTHTKIIFSGSDTLKPCSSDVDPQILTLVSEFEHLIS